MASLYILWPDQLSLPLLEEARKTKDIVLLAEAHHEFTHVKHHKKKIAFILSAMRHFKEELKQNNYASVVYKPLEEKIHFYTDAVAEGVATHKPSRIITFRPSSYRQWLEIQKWEASFNIPVEIREDPRFFTTPQQFKKWAGDKKALRMEFFYREVRKSKGILMDGNSPVGGKWNYDHDNRTPPKKGLKIPAPFWVEADDITQGALKDAAHYFNSHFGDLEPFGWATTRKDALDALDYFITHKIKNFGTYQDAMVTGEPWMYHAQLSFYLNVGLLTADECVKVVECAYVEESAPLNAVEGFIRQIIGWREYVRGIYWLKMPGYKSENFFDAKRPLPALYWGHQTKMNCLKQCVKETKENAYAHHIQRLMVLGNFALLAGLDPEGVNEWYMIVYGDAFEWVELPNVTGMILFADGGFLGSKPYIAGGNYINKMSDYCKSCAYNVKEKNGKSACPFNYLYWNFLITHHDKLKTNQRLGIVNKRVRDMPDSLKQTIQQEAQDFLESL